MSLEVNDANLKPCHHSNELTFSPMQATFRIYIIPSMCFFGIFANLINICVFGHKQVYKAPIICHLKFVERSSKELLAPSTDDYF